MNLCVKLIDIVQVMESIEELWLEFYEYFGLDIRNMKLLVIFLRKDY